MEDVLQTVDEDEPIMEGSDDEFQEEGLHEVQEEDEMAEMSTANCITYIVMQWRLQKVLQLRVVIYLLL